MAVMTRSKRMQPMVRMAEHREREAARVLGESRRHLEHHEGRLAELIAYRDEYTDRYRDCSGGGMGAMRLNEYRVFLERLNQAIEQQREAVEQARIDCEQRRQGWLASRTRTQALGKAVERFHQEERRERGRREQREQDDRVQRPRAPDEADGDD